MLEKALGLLVPGLTRYRCESVPDDDLVNRYTHERAEEAFTELVRRHGPMVLSVCRRVLRNSADADDVFQATFMVLAARKAVSIRPRELGRVGMAFTASRSEPRRKPSGEPPAGGRRRVVWCPANRHRKRPRPMCGRYSTPNWLDYRSRSPRFWSSATWKGALGPRWQLRSARARRNCCRCRLSRAREALAARLTRRGIALTAGAVGTAVGAEAGAAVPPELLAGTVKTAFAFGTGKVAESASPGALALANAVLRAAGARFRFLVVSLVVTVVAVTGWAAQTSAPAPQPQIPDWGDTVGGYVPKQPLPPAPDPVVALREKLTGQWRVNEGTRDNRPLTDWEKEGFQFDFNASGALTVHRGQVWGQRDFTWAVEGAPPALLLTPPRNKAGAIRVNLEFRENAIALSWEESPLSRGGPRGAGTGTTYRVVLSKELPAGSPAELVVTSIPQNVIGSRPRRHMDTGRLCVERKTWL